MSPPPSPAIGSDSGRRHPEMSQSSSIRSRFCPSVNPRLSIIDFCLLLQPRNLQDSREVGTQSCSRRLDPCRGRGEERRPLSQKAPGPRRQLPSHLCRCTQPTRVLCAAQPQHKTRCSNSCNEERGSRGCQDCLCPVLLVGHRKRAPHRFRGHSEVSRQASSSRNDKRYHANRRLRGKTQQVLLPKSFLGLSARTQEMFPMLLGACSDDSVGG